MLIVSVMFKLIPLSKWGRVQANRLRFSKLISQNINLSLPKLSRTNSEPIIYDLVMWGTLNPDKGFDRLISVCRRNQNIRAKVLSRSNSFLEAHKTNGHLPENIEMDLRSEFITDLEIDTLLLSSKFAFLPQRQATQSAQLALAISRGVPVICSDIPAFDEFKYLEPWIYCLDFDEKIKLDDTIKHIIDHYDQNIYNDRNLQIDRIFDPYINQDFLIKCL